MVDILSDKLVFRRASGITVDKTGYLESLTNPANIYDQLDIDEIEEKKWVRHHNNSHIHANSLDYMLWFYFSEN